MSLETQCHVGCLIVSKVAGKFAKGYQSEIERLLSCNGPEWTTNRLKACWNAALHLKSGNTELARSVYQQNSIAYHKSSMLPKGPIGSVVREFVKSRKPSVQRRWAAVLRFYTSIRLKSLSEKQFDKAYKAINTLPTVPANQIESLSKRIVDEVMQSLRNPRFKQEPKISYADELRGTAKYYSRLSVPKELRAMPYSSMTLSLITNSWVPESLNSRTPCKELRDELRVQAEANDGYVGRISFIQEAGCKARVVAQPSAWLQLAFRPLDHVLRRFYLRMFPLENCVQDQENGIWKPIEMIARNQSPISVDLSSATDRLPRFLQTYFLERVGLKDFGDALEEVCQRPFRADWKGKEIPFYYRTGQPMGLYGSFPLLNITNLFIGRYSELHAGIPAEAIGHTFHVLGDDIIFLNDKVAHVYKQVMEKLGVEVSPTKCRSGRVAEFAGFVVLPTSRGATAFRPYKVPNGRVLTNPVDFLHSLGVKASSLSREWERRFRAYRLALPQLTHCLSPLIPAGDDIGVSSTFRADNSRVKTITNMLTMSMEGLPDLSLNTRINSIPLFLERRMFDFYGYNPEEYRKRDVGFAKALALPGIAVYNNVEQHPTFSPILKELKDEEELAKTTDSIERIRSLSLEDRIKSARLKAAKEKQTRLQSRLSAAKEERTPLRDRELSK